MTEMKTPFASRPVGWANIVGTSRPRPAAGRGLSDAEYARPGAPGGGRRDAVSAAASFVASSVFRVGWATSARLRSTVINAALSSEHSARRFASRRRAFASFLGLCARSADKACRTSRSMAMTLKRAGQHASRPSRERRAGMPDCRTKSCAGPTDHAPRRRLASPSGDALRKRTDLVGEGIAPREHTGCCNIAGEVARRCRRCRRSGLPDEPGRFDHHAVGRVEQVCPRWTCSASRQLGVSNGPVRLPAMT